MTDGVDAPIVLVSTRTIDHLPVPGGSCDIPGGPATYVAEALQRLGRPFTLITGERADVQVQPTPSGQEYLIPAIAPIPLPPCLTGPAVIISPIVGEVPPESVPPVDGLLVVDLQGFVRESGRSTGEWTRRFELAALIRRAGIVKASLAELERLTPDSLAALRGVVLLETLGADGLVVRESGRRHRIRARPVPSAHTIGAGDTLLAGFVDAFLDGADPAAAARQAADFTASVLLERAGV